MKAFSALCVLAAAPTAVEACTAIAVGSKATADGILKEEIMPHETVYHIIATRWSL